MILDVANIRDTSMKRKTLLLALVVTIGMALFTIGAASGAMTTPDASGGTTISDVGGSGDVSPSCVPIGDYCCVDTDGDGYFDHCFPR